MEDVETTTEKESFGDSISTKTTSDVMIPAGPEGKTYLTGACRYCGEPFHNVEVKDGKAKCPNCDRDV